MKTKTKTKNAPKPTKPKKPNRNRHTILLTARIETHPMTEADARILTKEIEDACEHTLLAISPGHEVLKGKCAKASTEAELADKDAGILIVEGKKLSTINALFDQVDTELTSTKHSLLKLHDTTLDDVTIQIDQVDDEFADLETAINDLAGELQSILVLRTL